MRSERISEGKGTGDRVARRHVLLLIGVFLAAIGYAVLCILNEP